MNRLITANPRRWVRVLCVFNRYEFMTYNAAETWNSKILWARMLPIVSMLECVRIIMETWFTERRDAALKHNQTLCEVVSRKISDLRRQESVLNVTSLGNYIYKVFVDAEIFVVNLEVRTCECGKFQGLLMSCIHVVAAIG
ncbi:hypothetical protein ACS0TY_031163 [Phlomoides rotata]